MTHSIVKGTRTFHWNALLSASPSVLSQSSGCASSDAPDQAPAPPPAMSVPGRSAVFLGTTALPLHGRYRLCDH